LTKRRAGGNAASVHRLLLNRARETNRTFNELLQHFAMERFLYRLSKSSYSDRFVLKGALMLSVWNAPRSRPTMDIDLLGRTSNDVEAVTAAMRDVCIQNVEPDGMAFDLSTVRGERITEDADYEGVRVRIQGNLGTALVVVRVDVGFGDVVIPPAEVAEWQPILDFPAPRLLGYSRESTIAEKLEAMVRFGALNSRMKDFFDIWLLCRHFDFDGQLLGEAVEATFSKRGGEIPPVPVAFTPSFAEDPDKIAQWRAFLRRNQLTETPAELPDLIDSIATFLAPITKALAAGKSFQGAWHAPGPWRQP
jgi:predicted nucleotidyltransferase component of viral defense system